MEAIVLWEVSKKQQYIFASNKLKENRGASFIIEDIIETMPPSVFKIYENELIYNGGGSSLYKFPNEGRARDFVKKISEKALRDYPGIELFMVVVPYDEDRDKITEIINKAYGRLAVKKNRREFSGEQIAFGIERICESTGLPASFVEHEPDNERRFISKEIKTKINYADRNPKRFNSLLPVAYSIKEFQDLTQGEKNYLAVVHIDGNQMGKKLDRLKQNFNYENANIKEINEKYLKTLKDFSDDIKNAFTDSFRKMADIIYANKESLAEDTKIKEDKFPLIPIIIAGDDITYVTAGKIGIESARVFLEHLNSKKITINGVPSVLNGCAGVAIAKSGYPFAKTYELAESLCANAKKKILDDYGRDGKDYSVIDWHIEQGDIIGSISEIRDANYKSLDCKTLNMRPLYLNNSEKWTNYKNFREAKKYIKKLEIWNKKIARNKVKELREVLKKGEKETKLFLLSNKIDNYFPRFADTEGDYCFYDDHCMYYDAIEAMDLFIDLE